MPIATCVLVSCSGAISGTDRGATCGVPHFATFSSVHLSSHRTGIHRSILPPQWQEKWASSRLHTASPARFCSCLIVSPYLTQYKIWVPVLHWGGRCLNEKDSGIWKGFWYVSWVSMLHLFLSKKVIPEQKERKLGLWVNGTQLQRFHAIRPSNRAE